MKKLLIVAALFAFSAPLSACNTIEGIGQDLESAGEKIQSI